MTTTATPDTKNWCDPCKDGKPDNCEYGGKPCEEWYREQDEKAAAFEASRSNGQTDTTGEMPASAPGMTTQKTPGAATKPPGSSYSGGSDYGYGGGYSGYGGYGKQNTGFPIALRFKCVACNHWF